MPAIINDKPKKNAPAAMISRPYVDDRTLLVEKTKEKLGAKAKGMHFFYGDKAVAETGRYADDGYIPCGVNHRGDPLFMRPDTMHDEHLAQAAGDSQAAAQAAKTASKSEYKTRTADGELVGPQQEK
jgi:hypothetical protein